MKIAIVGMGDSWKQVLDEQDSFDELWTINYYYELKGLKTPDRVYDVHDLYYYRDSREEIEKHIYHWDEYLTKEKPFRFFAPLEYKEVPGLEVYPIQDVISLLDGFKRKSDNGLEDIKMWTSSFDYLMSNAIKEKPEEIHLFGWTMGWNRKSNETEYLYQLPGLAFWTGYALGQGIKVFVDKEAPVFKARMYTYQGGSVITRQTLETFKRSFEVQLQESQARFHAVEAEFKLMVEMVEKKPQNKLYRESFIKKQQELNEALTNLVRTEACLNLTQHFLDNVDTAEMDTDIKSQLIRVVDGDIGKALKGSLDD